MRSLIGIAIVGPPLPLPSCTDAPDRSEDIYDRLAVTGEVPVVMVGASAEG